MSVTVLVMLLPNVCNSISQQLPQLFFILYRMLCWNKRSKPLTDSGSDISEGPIWPSGERRDSWEMAGTFKEWFGLIIDASHDLLPNIAGPKADPLFTFLYGLCVPAMNILTVDFLVLVGISKTNVVNLLDFVKAPSKYWENNHMLVTSEDEEHFKSRTEVYPLFTSY
jgi:hypothetical protein